ncbi:hypothetical protein [Nocardia sp. NBC_01327]|uniref:hypothetical protein n=1 Tax=Nocardia sp. NBC_01327 TaxID=2903593 RepID=UPI002E13B156|nr:hypothetical protein OG326_24140 [Nocardia sp. NBC_01327]
MPDQDLITPDPIPDEELRAATENGWAPFGARMAAELLAARARIAELQTDWAALGEALDKIARYAQPDEDGTWTDSDGLLEGIGNAVEATGRKVWEADTDA